MKILRFTPLHPGRLNNPFLDPCRKRRAEIDLDHRIVQTMEHSGPEPIGLKHLYAFQIAISRGYDWVFTIEDDIIPPLNILDILDLEHSSGTLVCSASRLRGSPVFTPMSILYGPWGQAMRLKPLTIGVPSEVGLFAGACFAYEPRTLKEVRWPTDKNNDWDQIVAKQLIRLKIPMIYKGGACIHYNADNNTVWELGKP